jgi:glycosyltransferase involved in cell wall biosynthesis
MTQIAILAQTIATGDAVGNDVCGMGAALSKAGHNVRLYAEGSNVAAENIWPAAEIDGFLNGEGVVIYHHSIGWHGILDLLSGLRSNRIVVKYHNVTPSRFFFGISSDFETRCRLGRAQLATIAQANYDVYLADSHFNLDELLDNGVSNARAFVVPPFHHADTLLTSPPDFDVLDSCRDGKVNIIMVGRVSPNKGHARLIEAFANYYYEYNRHSKLFIIGTQEEAFRNYNQALTDLIASLWLKEAVIFTGVVTSRQLKAYYMGAHVFVISSEHEGFCVPLVEAMAMKIPIVAYSSSAISETLGDGAILWAEHNPRLIAESINKIVNDDRLRADLGLREWRRYHQLFSNERIEESFFTALTSVL